MLSYIDANEILPGFNEVTAKGQSASWCKMTSFSQKKWHHNDIIMTLVIAWSEKFNLVRQTALTWGPGRETRSHSGMLNHTHGKRPWVRCSSIPVSPWPQWSSARLYQYNGDPISKTWKYQGIWVRGLDYNTSSRMYQNKQSNIMSISCSSANVMTWLLLRVQDVSNEGGQTNSFPAPDPLINVTWCDLHDTFLVMEWHTTPDTF